MARKRSLKTKSEKAVKSTKAEMERRVMAIYKLMVNGITARADIHQYVSEQYKAGKIDWTANERSIDDYIARARELLTEHGKFIREEAFGTALARLESLFARNISITDFKAALATQKEINALLGLYPPKSLEIQTWETKALEYIRQKKVTYPAIAKQYGEDLAMKLFMQAGVPVEIE